MADDPKSQAKKSTPISAWLPPVLIGWVVPGGGHFYLKRNYRGMLLGISTVICFAFGLLMRGSFFEPQNGDLLTTLIYTGGYIANLCSGIPYFLASWLGYSQIDVAGHVHDYGTKFLAGAGLLNVLAMVDAFEIATGEKD
jgi:TM2 domain-containing membrane protein YozV